MKTLQTTYLKLQPVYPSLTKGLDGSKTFKELKLLAKAARRFQDQMIDIETETKTKVDSWNEVNPPLKEEDEDYVEKANERAKALRDFQQKIDEFHKEELEFDLTKEELQAIQEAVLSYKPSKDVQTPSLIAISEFLDDVEAALE